MSHMTLAQDGCPHYVIHASRAVFVLALHRLSHLPFHSLDLHLQLPRGSVRREVPCALPRMRSKALWPTTPLTHFVHRVSAGISATKPDLPRTTVLGKSFHYAEKIHFPQ